MAHVPRFKHYHGVIFMVAVLCVAVAGVMLAIEMPMPPVYQTVPGATNHGYTWSLSFFILPLGLLVSWMIPRRESMAYRWQALKLSIVLVVLVWSVLDIFAALTIFEFPNPGATIGLGVPGWAPGNGFRGRVPIEEFVFYVGGAATTVLLYIWAGEEWFGHYQLRGDDFVAAAKKAAPVVVVHGRSVAIGTLILLAGLAYKKLGDHSNQEGLPVYFFFLLLLVVGPAALLFAKLRHLVNVRAMIFTMQAIAFISLGWEVTLALPYGWWAYNPEYMLGVFIAPWFGLPIEAAFLWFASGWSGVFTFELLRAYKASGLPLRQFLFGAHRGTEAGEVA